MNRLFQCSLLIALAIVSANFGNSESDSAVGPLAASESPHVILILTDDQGFGDVGFHGNTELKTPHLDRLASESAEFTNFYVQPLCTPTRAALLTGRYPERTGAVEVNFGRSIIRESEITVA